MAEADPVRGELRDASTAPGTAQGQPLRRRRLLRLGLLIVVPLVIESRTIGSMGVAFDRTRRFTRDDQNVVSIVAQHCAQALERARLLEAEQLARQTLDD